MANLPPAAKETLRLAKGVGGDAGQMLAAAVERALEPDLTQRTKIDTMLDAGLVALGAYDPQPVAIATKKKMRSDAQLQYALSAVKAPILSAPFHFECRSAEIHALLTEVFIKSGFLHELLAQSLNAVDFGFQACEALWRLEESFKIEWDMPNADGGMDVKDKTYSDIFLPRRFKDLDPAKVTLLRDNNSDLVGLIHGATPTPLITTNDIKEAMRTSKVNVLNADKTFLFTPTLEWGNYRGVGRLDWAYDPWFWQNVTYLIALRWYERKADPPYVLYAPADMGLDGSTVDESTSYDAAGNRVDSMVLGSRALAKLRSTGGVVLPSQVFMDDEGRPSAIRAWELREVKIQDMHPAFLDFINHLDKKKTRAVLAPEIGLNRDREAGTLGSTEISAGISIEMQNQTLGAFIRIFNQKVLTPFLRYNGLDKERARLSSTGVLPDNRRALQDFTLKVLEADMLAEQAWGRVFPTSLTQMVDREALVRELGVPHRLTDPNAPLPKPPPAPEPTDEAKAGKAKVSGTPKGKTNPGGGRAKADASEGGEGRSLDTATDPFRQAARAEAERMATWAHGASEATTARQTLTTHEKAVIALTLYFLLASGKRNGAGEAVEGDTSVRPLVFDDNGVKSPAALADALPALAERAKGLEATGLVVDTRSPATVAALGVSRNAIQQTLGGLPDAVRGTDIAVYVAQAAAAGEAAAASLSAAYGVPFAEALSLEAVESIIRDNVDGVILNIQNIARRSAQNLIERMLMAAGRRLGLVNEALTFTFVPLYSDLTLEAHLWAAYRRGAYFAARKNGARFFLKVSASGGSDYDGVVGDEDFWNKVGEGHGSPMPMAGFGLHHGSKSIWVPVPDKQRIVTKGLLPTSPSVVSAA